MVKRNSVASTRAANKLVLSKSAIAEYFDADEILMMFDSISFNCKTKTKVRTETFFYGGTNLLRGTELRRFLRYFTKNRPDYTNSLALFEKITEKELIGTVEYGKLPDSIFYGTGVEEEVNGLMAYNQFWEHLKDGTLAYRGDSVTFLSDIRNLYNAVVANPKEGIPKKTLNRIGDACRVSGTSIRMRERSYRFYVEHKYSNKPLFYTINQDFLKCYYDMFCEVLERTN
jgi:hypothetical protein